MSLINQEPAGLMNHLQNQLNFFFPRDDTDLASLPVDAEKNIGTERELHIEGDLPPPASKRGAKARWNGSAE